MDISVYLLGAPRIEREGITVHVDTRKALALVSYLAVQAGYQSRDTIGALLWPESDQSGARGALRRTLSVLHKALGGTGLHIEREAIALNQAELWCDLVAFRTALAECGSHGHAAQEVCEHCLDPLMQAVSLYRGDFCGLRCVTAPSLICGSSNKASISVDCTPRRWKNWCTCMSITNGTRRRWSTRGAG
jgi:two-component SAPR family response regulator